ncbi:MAG: hypothetical protein K8R58_07920 [Bacteroidales bacterium]|nr:hypothetical protein [Bacteroidales bacterium]
MKKFIKILLFCVPFLIVLNACESDEDDNVNPEVDPRDNFLGNWNVNETCQRDAYSVTIVVDPSNSSQVLIKNFW